VKTLPLSLPVCS